MASTIDTLNFLLDQLHGLNGLSTRRMFGEYCVYLAEKPVALLCDDQLFVKPTAAGRALLQTPVEGTPYPGAKPYLLVTADLWEEGAWLQELLVTTAAALPRQRKRTGKPPAAHKKGKP